MNKTRIIGLKRSEKENKERRDVTSTLTRYTYDGTDRTLLSTLKRGPKQLMSSIGL